MIDVDLLHNHMYNNIATVHTQNPMMYVSLCSRVGSQSFTMIESKQYILHADFIYTTNIIQCIAIKIVQ